MQGVFNIHKSVWYTTLTDWRIKTYDHLNRCRKSSWQNSTPIYVKTSPESGHRGKLSQHNKDKYDKPIANIILKHEKLKAFPLSLGTRQRCPLSLLFFNVVLAVREEKEIKGIQIGKKK